MAQVYRLANSREIACVLKAKTKLHTNVFTIFYLKNTKQAKGFRYALIVSKKVSLKAVVRNKIKRQLRAMLKEANLHETNVDLVIVVKPQFIENSYGDNAKIFKKVIQKIN